MFLTFHDTQGYVRSITYDATCWRMLPGDLPFMSWLDIFDTSAGVDRKEPGFVPEWHSAPRCSRRDLETLTPNGYNDLSRSEDCHLHLDSIPQPPESSYTRLIYHQDPMFAWVSFVSVSFVQTVFHQAVFCPPDARGLCARYIITQVGQSFRFRKYVSHSSMHWVYIQ